ncbi:protein-export chaperone SecB [Magnetospirillum fulvum]|uniref:Protein-export protein SecB n=1 Tax=Magnetospirillum fulvum MGU-K5 TaxID=1316936 RepID=S9SGF2_MAGFU|nr:protein-export chaperone SecB [Magnetospirillum fulvum]EPY03163.1 preprotein translocase subunit SecB [Magnetospirillum fulvum MGU-K5]
MTDSQNPTENAPALKIHGQYIKDLSFEIPNAPQVFLEAQGEAPEIPIQVDVSAGNVGQNLFEVVLRLRVEARTSGKALFIVELDYAGLFALNLPEDQIAPYLLIECPRLLFPFARAIIADVTRDGGFPPLVLQPLDFVALYRTRLEEQAAAGTA